MTDNKSALESQLTNTPTLGSPVGCNGSEDSKQLTNRSLPVEKYLSLVYVLKPVLIKIDSSESNGNK